MSKYDKFRTTHIQVPVQFGHLSKENRLALDLGWTGKFDDPDGIYEYYKIGSRFLSIHIVRKEVEGVVKRFRRYRYMQYKQLPDEIKQKIEAKDEVTDN